MGVVDSPLATMGPGMTVREVSAPTRTQRLYVALAIGIVSGAIAALRFARMPWHPSDFGQLWFGAVALRHGADPYALVGPGLQYDWPWKLFYPVTSMVVALPLSYLPEMLATFLFVAVSGGLLAYALTEERWGRLALLLSWPFVVAVTAGQWSPILTAAVILPSLGWLWVAKPNMGIAILAATSSARLLKIALIGGAAIIVMSIALFPNWPREWLASLAIEQHMGAPIMRTGGILILLGLLRWKRPEARLLVALACVPQTNSWYEGVPVLLAASTFRESLFLSGVSLLGYFIPPYIMTAANESEFNAQMGALMVALCYMPAILLVVRRPNEGELPAWLTVGRKWRQQVFLRHK
jgi:hypothetical protein